MPLIEVLKVEFFPNDDPLIQPLKNILPTLFLQNIEYLLQENQSPSYFIHLVEFFILDQTQDLPDGELSESAVKSFNKNADYIKKLLKEFAEINSFKQFIRVCNPKKSKSGSLKEFSKSMKIIIQRILLVLMSSMQKIDDPKKFISSEEFSNVFKLVKNQEISYDFMMLFTFLNFLQKNCRIYSELGSINPSEFIVDSSFAFLNLHLSEDGKLKMFHFSDEYKIDTNYFEKKKINISLKDEKREEDSKIVLDYMRSEEESKISSENKKSQKKSELSSDSNEEDYIKKSKKKKCPKTSNFSQENIEEESKYISESDSSEGNYKESNSSSEIKKFQKVSKLSQDSSKEEESIKEFNKNINISSSISNEKDKKSESSSKISKSQKSSKNYQNESEGDTDNNIKVNNLYP